MDALNARRVTRRWSSGALQGAAVIVPASPRGAVFGIVAAGTLPGLVAPFLSGRLIDAATTKQAGYSAACLIAATVLLLCGAFALAAIRPERDIVRLRGSPRKAPTGS